MIDPTQMESETSGERRPACARRLLWSCLLFLLVGGLPLEAADALRLKFRNPTRGLFGAPYTQGLLQIKLTDGAEEFIPLRVSPDESYLVPVKPHWPGKAILSGKVHLEARGQTDQYPLKRWGGEALAGTKIGSGVVDLEIVSKGTARPVMTSDPSKPKILRLNVVDAATQSGVPARIGLSWYANGEPGKKENVTAGDNGLTEFEVPKGATSLGLEVSCYGYRVQTKTIHEPGQRKKEDIFLKPITRKAKVLVTDSATMRPLKNVRIRVTGLDSYGLTDVAGTLTFNYSMAKPPEVTAELEGYTFDVQPMKTGLAVDEFVVRARSNRPVTVPPPAPPVKIVTKPKTNASGYLLVLKDQQSGRKLSGVKVTVAGQSGRYLSDAAGEVRLDVRSKSDLNGLSVEYGEFGVAEKLLGSKKGWVYLAKVIATPKPVVPVAAPTIEPKPTVPSKPVVVNPAPQTEMPKKTRQSGTATIESASMELPWVNSLGMEFVPVPGTSVLFCRWETSQLDFAKFTGTEDEVRQRSTATHPVGYISWAKAMAFCEWLTRRERELGLITAGQLYRLPRDVEWSQAVGMPPENGVTPYQRKERSPIHHPNWSPTLETLGGNYSDESSYEKYGARGNRVYLHRFHKNFRYRDGYPDTAPVNSFKGNLYGIHNLGGNVAEWCLDQYGGPGHTDSQHYLRGGSYLDGYLALTYSGARMPIDSFSEGRSPQHGFRVVLDKGRR